MNFAITGLGRSGTTFLSKLMNRSQVWSVLHEPGSHCDLLENVQKRFGDHYGEVNPYLVEWLEALDVTQKGVLIRNPRDVVLSTYNRRHKKLTHELDRIGNRLKFLDRFIERGIYCIQFEKMTTDLEYLQSCIEHFGIQDVQCKPEDIQIKVNRNPTYYVFKYEDIDHEIRQIADQKIDWFVEKYYTAK